MVQGQIFLKGVLFNFFKVYKLSKNEPENIQYPVN